MVLNLLIHLSLQEKHILVTQKCSALLAYPQVIAIKQTNTCRRLRLKQLNASRDLLIVFWPNGCKENLLTCKH